MSMDELRTQFKRDIEAAGFVVPAEKFRRHIDYFLSETQKVMEQVGPQYLDAARFNSTPIMAIPARKEGHGKPGILCLTNEMVVFSKAPFWFFEGVSDGVIRKNANIKPYSFEYEGKKSPQNLMVSWAEHSVDATFDYPVTTIGGELYEVDEKDAANFIAAAQSLKERDKALQPIAA